VRILHSRRNQGAASSLNMGIEHAKGEWIAIHDSDDVSHPARLEIQIEYLKSHPGSVGVGSLIKAIPGLQGSTKPDQLIAEENYYNRILTGQQILDYRLFSCYLCHGSVIFSKEAFNQVGRYNPEYKICYDYDLWLRLFDLASIKKV